MIEAFVNVLGKESVLKDEPMSKHTTFKIGGNADFFLMPKTEKQLLDCLKVCKELSLPTFILGNGSNLLVGDKGIRGAVICLFKGLDEIKIDKNEISAGAGVTLSRLSTEALNSELSGLEFASGIPGTLGGGVYMNAGAYGHELKDVIKSVRCIDSEGNVLELESPFCEFGYRESIFSKKGYTVLSATFSLNKDEKDLIRERISDFTKRRVSKQPIEKPSAGSVFKRPEGYFAGTLIEEAGLKGFSIGDAQVSEKHAGFIINKGSAKACEVLELIKHIQKTVYERNGVNLETEVKFIGEF